MTYLVEVPVGAVGAVNGQRRTVGVEINGARDGLVQVARPGEVVARAARSLGDMLAGVRPIAEDFVESLSGMAHAPHDIEVEFGLSLSAKADVIVSSTTGEATFKVKLTWHRDEPAQAVEPAS